MPKALILAARASGDAFNATNYISIAGSPANSSTEAWVQVTSRTAGTFSNMAIRFSANSSTSTTLVFRKNATTVNQTVSFGNAETGQKEDTTNTDTISAGDAVNFQVSSKTNTVTIVTSGVLFSSSTSTDTVTLCSCDTSVSYSGATATSSFNVLVGGLSLGASEAICK